MFLGFVPVGTTPALPVLVAPSGTPVNTDASPTYRVYGPAGLMSGGTGTLSKLDSGTITNATNANPISVSSTAHGLTTGTTVTITGVTGNTAANGIFVVTVVDANTFTLNGSTGNGSYVSGGTWNVTGLYKASVACTTGNGYASGETYSILVQAAISTVAFAQLHTFVVT